MFGGVPMYQPTDSNIPASAITYIPSQPVSSTNAPPYSGRITLTKPVDAAADADQSPADRWRRSVAAGVLRRPSPRPP